MARQTQAQPQVSPAFFTKIGAKAGELTTASGANANLFFDGYKAGYAGSKKAHEERRVAMQNYLVQKYNL